MVRPLFFAAAALILVGACDNNFQKESIVVDLRALAVRTDPAEVVVAVDPNDLTSVQLPPVSVTALFGDPMGPRALAYTMTACPVTDDLRCDDVTQPNRVFKDDVSGDVDGDPPFGVLQMDIPLLQAALAEDNFHGLGGIPVQIELVVRPAGAGDDAAVHASKQITYAADFPAGRTANQNPTIDELDADDKPFDADTPLVVHPGQVVTLLPIEPDGVRETYVVPTLDGGTRTLTENLRYSWFATAGSFSDEHTGGPTDVFGNIPLLRTLWTAPGTVGPVRLWLVQRDERGGTYWTKRAFMVQN